MNSHISCKEISNSYNLLISYIILDKLVHKSIIYLFIYGHKKRKVFPFLITIVYVSRNCNP